jgi:hypothetical protein
MRSVSLGTSKKPPQVLELVGGGFDQWTDVFKHDPATVGTARRDAQRKFP